MTQRTPTPSLTSSISPGGSGRASPCSASCSVGILLGVVIIPVVQGRSAGIDAYTAICRALGILPGSPAQPQPVDRTPPTPVSQVVWTPDVLQILADAEAGTGPRKGAGGLRRLPRRNRACRPRRSFRIWPVNRARRSTSSSTTIGQAAARIQLMTDIAKALDEPTFADIAAYYAAQPKRNPNPVTLAESPAAIVRLVELGDPSRNIPPCASCHRPGSGGPIETPDPRRARSRNTSSCSCKLYASGERRNDVYGRMRIIAAKLTPAEIEGLAAYYRAGFK